MRKLFFIFSILTLVGCGAPDLSKKGTKIGQYTMVEDAEVFSTLEECKAALSKANNKYGVNVKIDAQEGIIYINTGNDSSGVEYFNSCTKQESANNYILRITKA